MDGLHCGRRRGDVLVRILLLPPFITSVTDSASRVGIVFAVISLAAMVGPLVGRLTARTKWYRSTYLGAMLMMSGSFALLIHRSRNMVHAEVVSRARTASSSRT